MNMRRKPQQSGGSYNNQHRRSRHSHSGGGQSNHGQNRGARKNYPAMREKYLTQARDALASGDRVLAENYFQHAEHCYRMMVEEGYNPRQPQPQEQVAQEAAQSEAVQQPEEILPHNPAGLPSFITVGFENTPQPPVSPETIQNWEERDA